MIKAKNISKTNISEGEKRDKRSGPIVEHENGEHGGVGVSVGAAAGAAGGGGVHIHVDGGGRAVGGRGDQAGAGGQAGGGQPQQSAQHQEYRQQGQEDGGEVNLRQQHLGRKYIKLSNLVTSYTAL